LLVAELKSQDRLALLAESIIRTGEHAAVLADGSWRR